MTARLKLEQPVVVTGRRLAMNMFSKRICSIVQGERLLTNKIECQIHPAKPGRSGMLSRKIFDLFPVLDNR